MIIHVLLCFLLADIPFSQAIKNCKNKFFCFTQEQTFEKEMVKRERISLESFVAHFNTEEACSDYLFQMKWPNGFACPRCNHRHFYKKTSRRLPLNECASCHHQASLTVSTVMESSRTSLQKWFLAFYLVSRPHSISTIQLMKKIHVTYKTAWSMLHKIRHALGEEDASVLLSGFIQVQDACSGKILHSIYHRQSKEHLFLVGAVMNEGN
jgi:transposase-like protein